MMEVTEAIYFVLFIYLFIFFHFHILHFSAKDTAQFTASFGLENTSSLALNI